MHKNMIDVTSRKRRRLLIALLAATSLVRPPPALAASQVTAANSATNVYNAANGVTVVNIAKANGAGISHNKYTDYNVDSTGLVLNNGDTSQIMRQSQLAGAVTANTNLVDPAKVILNEVVSTKRSTLAGYTEVLGASADVVVANPNGVTCNGCGFINTSNATITTGKPILNTATGALDHLQVDNGDILITGNGADGSNQDYLGLIARSVRLEGQVNAKALDVIAGANDVDYATKAATPRTPTGTAPTLAIDSTALGGMYANRIRLVATETGVGVRTLGDAAAGTGDFTLDSAGKVEIGSNISAQQDVKVTVTMGGADAIKTTNAHLSAMRDVTLTATTGNVHLQGGALTATRNLAVTADSLTDESTTDSAADNNKRYAGGALTLNQTHGATIDGTDWGTAGALTLAADTLTVGADGATLYGDSASLATAHDLDLGAAALQSQGDLSLTATNGLISTASGGGVKSVGGDITLNAGNGLNNIGTITADGGDVTARLGGTVTNAGTLHASGTIDLADQLGNATETIANTGTLLADDALTLKGNTLNNSGNLQGTKGATLTLGSLSNSGKLILSANTSDSGTITADSLTNTTTGTLQSAKNLTLNVKNSLTNDHTIFGTGDVSILASDGGTTLALTNDGNTAIIQSGGVLKIGAAGHQVGIATQTGKLLAGDHLDFNLSALTNAGTIQGGTDDSTLSVANTLTNNSGAVLNLATGTTANGLVEANSVVNNGTLQSGGNLTVAAAGLTNNTTGKMLAYNDLTLRGLSPASYDINNYNIIQAKNGLLTIKGVGGSSAVRIYGDGSDAQFLGNTADLYSTLISLADGSSLTTAGNLTLTATSLSLGGSSAKIIAAQSGTGTGTITVNSGFTNNGLVYSGSNLSFNATSIDNAATGGLAAAGTLHAHATGSNFDNYGALYAGTLLDAQANSNFTNHDAGTMDGDNDITITAANTFTNNNNINAGHNLTISALYFNNEVPGGDTRTSTTSSPVTISSGWSNGEPCSTSSLCTNDTTDTFTVTETTSESYGTTPTHKPELQANGTLTIDNFQTGYNLGGIISGHTVDIASTVGGAIFTNDDYSLTSQTYVETYDDHGYCKLSELCALYYTDNGENNTGFVTSGSPTVTSFGAGIYANTLNASGFALVNAGSPYAATTTATAGSGGSGSSLSGLTTGASASPTATFGGLTITVPSNPNGYFIVSPDPHSKYLVETNPQYAVGSAFLGSDYIAQEFGIDLDSLERRLGDANYEASLIRQQLLTAGAASLLNNTDQAQAMQTLLDDGVDQGKALGLTYGVAPTAAQLASLTGNMVWMVDTVVDGQHVLAPVVYLSPATQSQIASGAVISGTNTNMQLASLTNVGGTIAGTDSLDITAQNDLINTSGTMTGGNVALTSTNGTILNQTVADTTGTTGNQHTIIGNTAGIVATGNLDVNAANDIINTGANMGAGGNANLNAGHDITFNTIQDKESSATHSGGNDPLKGGTETSSTSSSTTNIGSGLTVGGNLSTTSGNDTTFAGTNANIGGNASLNAGGALNIVAVNNSTDTASTSKSGTIFSGDSSSSSDHETTNVGSNFNVGRDLNSTSKGDTTIQGSNLNVTGNGSAVAGGNVNILDGQNTSDTASSSTHSGTGVGGGLYGVETTSDGEQKGTSVGSNLNFGGNGTLTSGNTLTVQGSNVGTGGDLAMNGADVNIVQGRNTDNTQHSDTTATFGKIEGPSNTSSNDSDAGATSGTDGNTANAEASASANSDRGGSGGITLAGVDTTTTNENKSTAAGSSIHSGGNTTIGATHDITVQGSNVAAGGDANLNAGNNVNILAAQNTDTKTTTDSSLNMGLYGESANHAGANADAKAGASADGTGNPNASANATADANATTDNTLDYMHADQNSTTTADLTHTGSSITSGGNMNINAGNQLNVNGSSAASGGDMNLNARDIKVTAANDSHTVTTTDSATKIGSYANGSADANANAGANADASGANSSAGMDANANAGVGYYGTNTTSSSMNGTTTAQTSSLSSGGNMTRIATGDITDVGTQVNAGGSYNQSSTTFESKAAQNTTTSSNSASTNTAKAGLYGSADANASANAGTGGVDNSNGVDASAGVEASYNQTKTGDTSNTSNAVVSNIHAGGGLTTTTTGKTSLEGTNLGSGGDMTLNAGSLDYKAAQDTTSTTGSKSGIDAGGKVGLDASKEVTVSLNGGYNSDDTSSASSTAEVGSMNSGGNLHVNTGGDANFTGTNIAAAGDAGINAGGNLNYSAAHNTSSSSENTVDAEGSASLSKSKGDGGGAGGNDGKGSTSQGLDLSGGYSTTSASEDGAVAGTIKSGGKLSTSSGGDTNFEGTQLASAGDTAVAAGGNVNFNAAQSTSSSSGYGVSGSLSTSKGGEEKGEDGATKTKGTSGSLSLAGNYDKDDETTQAAGGIASGGNVTVKSGKDTNLVGTNITSTGATTLDAGHNVNFTAATNTSNKVDVSGGLDASGSTASKPKTPVTKPAATETADKGKDAAAEDDGSEKEGSVDLDLSGGQSTTRTGGSINAGSIAIKSGNDTNLEGTKTNSVGDTSVNAGGNVNLNAAKSTDIEGGVAGSAGSGGASLSKASIGGGVTNDGVVMNSGGDTNIASNGKTTMQGATVDANGAANVDAKGGLDQQSTVSGEGDLGLDHAGAKASVQTTKITGKNQAPATPPLTFQQQVDKIKNDPTLTGAQKAKLLAALAAKHKAEEKPAGSGQ